MKKSNRGFIITVGIITVALIYFLAPILTPFLASGLIAYLLNPIVERMTRWHVPRTLAVLIVFLILFLVILALFLLLIPLIQRQIAALIDFIPKLILLFQNEVYPWLVTHLGVSEQINLDTIKTTLAKHWATAEGALTWVLTKVLKSGVTIILVITNLLLIPVVTFYLLRDWRKLWTNLRSLIPRSMEPTVVSLFKECDSVLSAFFRGQLLVMLSLAIIYSVGLTLIGLQIGLIIGVIAGLLTIVPYLGFIVGITSALIAAYVQFGTLTSMLLVLLVFVIGQIAETAFLTPKLVGDRIGLHPVAVIFAVLAGGTLFGFFGVLLALPVAAVIMVDLRFLHKQYRQSQLYQS